MSAELKKSAEASAPTGDQAPAEDEKTTKLTYKVKSQHDEAYLYLDQALSCDESRQIEQAMTLYNKAVRAITQSLSSYEQLCQLQGGGQTTTSGNLGVDEMVAKMRRTVAQVHSRVEELLLSQGAIVEVDATDGPPSYDQATNGSASSSDAAMSDATRLFYIEDGVQVFFITTDEYVSAPSYPSSLAVYQFGRGRPSTPLSTTPEDEASPPAFLQVGEWIYPLLPGRSPVLHANWGAYIFPDVSTDQEGGSVGVILPDSVNVIERTKFEKLLNTLTDMREQGTQRTSEAIAKGLSTAADWISWGLIRGAEKTKNFVEFGSGSLRKRMEPDSTKASVDPRVQRGAQYARRASTAAVRVSSYLVGKLSEATASLGKTLAPHIRRQSENYLPAAMTRRDSTNGRSTLDDVAEVTVSGLNGFSTIYQALENSAKILAKSIADETVQVVQHKFGEQAGELTEEVMTSVGNVAVTTHNLSHLGVKAIVKRSAKDTGRAVAEDTVATSSQL